MKKSVFLLFAVFAVIFQLAAAPGPWFTGKVGRQLVNASGKPIPAASLKGKMVGFYFSAHWCPPCRKFTPQLVKFYKKVSKKHNFEIVFVSSDRNSKAMQKYMKEAGMPWLAIPHGAPQIKALQQEFKVSGIPTLIVLDRNGRVVSKSARTDVARHGEKAIDLWEKGSHAVPGMKNKAPNKNKKAKSSKKVQTKR